MSFFGICFSQTINFASADVFESNAFRLVRQVGSDGKIGLAYIFPVNSTKLSEKGYSEQQISVFKFYLSTYVNALAQTNKNKATNGTNVGTCQYFSDVDGLGFSIIFDDLSAQNLFFGVQENSSSGEVNKKTTGLFMRKTELTTSFPFSQNSAGDLKMIVLMAMSSWASDQNLSSEQKKSVQEILNESVFVYDFATTQTSLLSDVMYDDQNFHHNVFVKTFDQLESDNSITFYSTSPNYPIWYLSALLVVVFGMVIKLLFYKAKTKSKK